jgi:hypothetical protein
MEKRKVLLGQRFWGQVVSDSRLLVVLNSLFSSDYNMMMYSTRSTVKSTQDLAKPKPIISQVCAGGCCSYCTVMYSLYYM